ncbi:helix-turn-helix domain-containing protein [Chryseobacterium nematophagum]|uniref:Helix-turn-helix domain-containing protein n=1 Tax=Chryseobacterium nematophagum TaxID=2305228 RepID=A0A3M7TED8_9FLAO|nr:helix-turn-helix domain-containing protein [Chryseobacterium nematophagum]RNA61434.1 helix-turn-helix domain-containing protein [Chryseobacterium nematophagum]
MKKSTINYKRIFLDILDKKYPHKKEEVMPLLHKSNFSTLDVIDLNKKIFGLPDATTEVFNQSHRAYTKCSILRILKFQKTNKLNNTQVAIHFKMSRHTLKLWKDKYFV